MDEEHAEVDVTSLGDPPEPPLQGAGELSGGEAEVAGKVAGGGEAVDVAHEGDEGRGDQETDAGDGEQPLDGGGLLGQGLQLALGFLDALFEKAYLLAELGEKGPQGVGHRGIGIGEDLEHPGEDVPCPTGMKTPSSRR